VGGVGGRVGGGSTVVAATAAVGMGEAAVRCRLWDTSVPPRRDSVIVCLRISFYAYAAKLRVDTRLEDRILVWLRVGFCV